MRRREVIFGLTAGAWPRLALAEQLSQVPHVAALIGLSANDQEVRDRVAAFYHVLQEHEWIDGKNIQITWRFSGSDADLLRAHAAELAGMRPNVLLTHGTPATAALLSSNIPVVFVAVSDPVGSGFVRNIARPEGNATGLTSGPFDPGLGGKLVQLLKDAVPSITRIGLVYNPKNAPHARHYLGSCESAAASRAIGTKEMAIYDALSIENVFSEFARVASSGLVILNDVFTYNNRKVIVESANRHRLPSVYPLRSFSKDGGLLSYGLDPIDLYRRAAIYIDRILHGTAITELPVQAPSKYELIINMKAARILGIEVPTLLLAGAEEVIE